METLEIPHINSLWNQNGEISGAGLHDVYVGNLKGSHSHTGITYLISWNDDDSSASMEGSVEWSSIMHVEVSLG